MATDPVCGMYVDERTAELRLVRENRTYSFCSSTCLEDFAAPERQLARLRLRLAIGWPLAAIILVLSYAHPFPGWPWAALALATVVQFYPGWQFLRGTYDALRNRIWNMDVLIAVGTTVAYAYSAAVVLLPSRLPPAYYFDASALIVTLILTGNYLEHLTRERARGSLRKLKELLPTTALILREGKEVDTPVAEVQPNDRFRMRPGGRFPTDGRILEGRSAVNEAVLTGESLPVEKGPGDPVIAGAINGEGPLTVQATKVGEDTLLAHIGQLVAEAETSRIPLQRLADRIAATFVPVVLVIAVVTSVGWVFLGVGLTIGLLAFVSVVITACPCAFGIATPAAILVGTGRAAEEGILFKGRDSIERASRADVVLTDKTGTLTKGEPVLTDILPVPGVDARRLLSLAGGLEQGSEHPLAGAVRRAATDQKLPIPSLQSVVALPGRGIQGEMNGRPVAILRGSAARDDGLGLGLVTPESHRLESEGKTWSVLLEDGRPIGILGFSDAVAPGVQRAILALAEDGIRSVMVTGDHEAAANHVAKQVGISEVYANVTPAGKLDLIKRFQARGARVAYVGDGINDAPALAAADLGIAIGAGTDVAKETGGVILVRSDFRGVALALRIGRRTVRKVKTNLAWAVGYNAVLLPIAAGALVPFVGLGVFQVLPITGALAMGLSSTSVVLNSLSLRWVALAGPRGAPPTAGALPP
ncbi:MAG: heavy metal translocating P-type ATPase [Thermoplasmata archaeon]|nr:heavy metal translocating P-type ATPase [Thermoplasmata archaeon]